MEGLGTCNTENNNQIHLASDKSKKKIYISLDIFFILVI